MIARFSLLAHAETNYITTFYIASYITIFLLRTATIIHTVEAEMLELLYFVDHFNNVASYISNYAAQ